MDWQGALIYIAVSIAFALVSWGLGILTKLINSKIKNETVSGYLSEADNIALEAVKMTYQTYVQSLKEQNKFDLDAQKEALEKAKNMFITSLSTNAASYFKNLFGDLNEWATNKIEAKLYDLKNNSYDIVIDGETEIETEIEETEGEQSPS